jgi:hypothetical protein
VRLGVDHPLDLAQWGEPGRESGGVRQAHKVVEEDKLAGGVQDDQTLQEQASEQTGKNPDMQEEAWAAGDPVSAIGGQPAAGNDHVDMGMMGHRRAPGVQYGGDADPGAKATGIGGAQHGLRRDAEQQVVDRLLVPGGSGRSLLGE